MIYNNWEKPIWVIICFVWGLLVEWSIRDKELK